MTSENHDFQEAVEVVSAILKIAGDPNIRRHLEKLREAAKKALNEAHDPDRRPDKEPEKGTCPTCRRSYKIKSNGALRRHGTGKCYTDDQLPAEVIPAILAIAQLGTDRGENSDGRTQDDSRG